MNSSLDDVTSSMPENLGKTNRRDIDARWDHARERQPERDLCCAPRPAAKHFFTSILVNWAGIDAAVAGLPSGSGVTESAAKTVINRRAKNSGQRWSVTGLRGVLTLRASLQNDRLLRFWSLTSYTAALEVA